MYLEKKMTVNCPKNEELGENLDYGSSFNNDIIEN